MTAHGDPGRRLPIKLDCTSNGEFAPVPLDPDARRARALAHAALVDGASRLGQSRRRYVVSLLGEFQEKFGYPALTPALKRKVFGLNAARVYGLKPDALRGRLAKDRVQRRKAEYLNDPRPSFATYGPRTGEEFLALRRLQGGRP